MAYGRKTGGRTKGTPNKTTTEVKKALQEAFEGMGGIKSLQKWGKENPAEFYKLWVKLLPVDVQSSDGSMSGPTTITIIRPGDEDGDQ